MMEKAGDNTNREDGCSLPELRSVAVQELIEMSREVDARCGSNVPTQWWEIAKPWSNGPNKPAVRLSW